jgi:hypothetical protein
VLAATRPLPAAAGQEFGPYVVFAEKALPEWQEQVRGFVLEQRTEQDVPLEIAEWIFPIEVSARQESRDESKTPASRMAGQ